ncbi:MAG: hypothetical protein H0V29_01845 [Thermoleophilaceae bacterium]|nr:hypothetical protein [Thermoleophilaceae bacterium]
MKPEDALEEARRRVAERRAAGGYPASETQAGPAPEAGERPTMEQLREWALIEVDHDLVYSTRPGGAPITGMKRLILRLLRQYTTELEAQQTRFNVAVLSYLEKLEEERRRP